MTPVVVHLETLRDFVRRGAPVALRRQLFANRARVATLAGRLAFFDLKDSLAAQSGSDRGSAVVRLLRLDAAVGVRGVCAAA
ncbi:MAG TPA: hypothetical protein VFQ44_10780 [Streptosporangiaceae bacterium]|nr:hypothetical protein [Streptosporangiaceae bacterium]